MRYEALVFDKFLRLRRILPLSQASHQTPTLHDAVAVINAFANKTNQVVMLATRDGSQQCLQLSDELATVIHWREEAVVERLGLRRGQRLKYGHNLPKKGG